MELGADKPMKLDVPIRVSTSSQTKKVKAPHARYAATVYGHGRDVYSAITSAEDESKLQGMLGNETSFTEHPRGDEENIRLVRMLKPIWRRGTDCFDWTEDSVLNTRILEK